MSLPLREETGRRIKTARAWASLSQPELAKLLQVTPRTVRRWETGESLPRAADLAYVARVCGVSDTFFFSEDPGLVPGEEFAQALEGRKLPD